MRMRMREGGGRGWRRWYGKEGESGGVCVHTRSSFPGLGRRVQTRMILFSDGGAMVGWTRTGRMEVGWSKSRMRVEL